MLSIALAACLLAVGCDDLQSSSAPDVVLGSCPVPTPNLLPVAWKPVGSGTLINIDGDADLECLVIYRYNLTAGSQGPLGGVVFDPQVSPDRRSNLVSYRLLPWVNNAYSITGTVPGSLPGLLGTLGEKAAEVRLYSTDGQTADELGIIGSDAVGNRTTLSLYRWAGTTQGYRLIGYFHGNDRVEIVSPPTYITATKTYSGVIGSVRAFDRFYDRSGLAMVYQYDRRADNQAFEYRANWVDFVDGRPKQTCYYPEGRTLIYYMDMDQQRPVFDLRLYSEDDNSRKAVVCAGTWNIQATEWRRYWALVELEKKPSTQVGACDEWVVLKEQIQPGRISCAP